MIKKLSITEIIKELNKKIEEHQKSIGATFYDEPAHDAFHKGCIQGLDDAIDMLLHDFDGSTFSVFEE